MRPLFVGLDEGGPHPGPRGRSWPLTPGPGPSVGGPVDLASAQAGFFHRDDTSSMWGLQTGAPTSHGLCEPLDLDVGLPRGPSAERDGHRGRRGTVASLPWISAIFRPGLPSLSSCTDDSRAASSCRTAPTSNSLWE